MALDWTSFAADEQDTIVLSMVTGHGRATPLLWKTVASSTLKGNQRRYEYRVAGAIAGSGAGGVSAVLGMRRQDYFGQESRGWLRLHEKGGSGTTFRPTTRAAAALDAYVEAAGLEEPKAALFQTVDPSGCRLTGRALDRRLVLAMIKRRAAGPR